MRILEIDPRHMNNLKRYNNDITDKKKIIAKFHSPSCPACKAMKNSWVELPKVIKQMGYNANKYDIANINVDELNNNELRGWQNIHYVPTIANINGNKANIYNGEMDTVSIAQFIIKEYKIPRIKKRRYYGGIKTKKQKRKRKGTSRK